MTILRADRSGWRRRRMRTRGMDGLVTACARLSAQAAAQTDTRPERRRHPRR